MFSVFFIFSYHPLHLIGSSAHLQDGSYSRGPVDIPVGKFDESKYFLSPTFKFEQVSCFSISSLLLVAILLI